MSIYFTSERFPESGDAKSRSGLPWGCIVQPLGDLVPSSILKASEIARCSNCFAYINPHIKFSRKTWRCSLCRSETRLSARYLEASGRLDLPELTKPFVEYDLDAADEFETDGKGKSRSADPRTERKTETKATPSPASAAGSAAASPKTGSGAAVNELDFPVYIFLVDLAGSEESVEMVKSAILAALEALSPDCWVGLAVFSSTLGLFNLHSSVPHVRYARIMESGPVAVGLPLDEMVPLEDFLAQLGQGQCKDNLAAAIESLTPHYKSAPSASTAPSTPATASSSASSPSKPPASASPLAPTSPHSHGYVTKSPYSSPFTPTAAAAVGSIESKETKESKRSDVSAAAVAAASAAAGESVFGVAALASTVKDSPGDHDSKGRSNGTASGEGQRLRGFGAAVESLTAYLGSSEHPLNVRVLTFLSGLPNFGAGKLVNRFGLGGGVGVEGQGPSGTEAKTASARKLTEAELMEEQSAFYRKHAEIAALSGTCFDLFVLSDLAYIDLSSLKYLTLLTGGNMLLYETLDDCSLPQDLFKQLKKAQAFRCLVRLRTSPEFSVGSVYGHLMADKNYENLFHMASCDARKCFAVDFLFNSGMNYDQNWDIRPVVQLAFAYSTVVRNAEGREVPVRRLRVHTRKIELARNTQHLYTSASPEVVVSLLTHQVIHESMAKGVQDARLLLKDWLVNLTACYNEAIGNTTVSSGASPSVSAATGSKATRKPKGSITADSLDFLFSKTEHTLEFLPRFIFGMLKHPLLSMNHVHPDVRVYNHCLFSGLEPALLTRSLYPTLSAFRDANTLLHRAIFASRADLERSGGLVFLLDNFTGLFCYFTERAADQQCPPAHESEIRKHIKNQRINAPLISPRVVFARAGSPAARFFEANLLEDADSMGFSFAQFAESVAADVVKVLNS